MVAPLAVAGPVYLVVAVLGLLDHLAPLVKPFPNVVSDPVQ